MADETFRDKPLVLSLKSGGREIQSFDLNGTQIIQDCASIGAEIVRKLLKPNGQEFNHTEPTVTNNISLASGTRASGVPATSTGKEVISWETIKQTVIPPYVKSVSFVVTDNDLDPHRQEELMSHFPGVTICTERSHLNSASDCDDEVECESQFAADQRLRQLTVAGTAPVTSPTPAVTNSPSRDAKIRTTVDITPATSAAFATPKPSLLSRMSMAGSEIRIKGVASGNVDDFDIPSGYRRTSSEPSIFSVATRIGLEIINPKAKVIHAMWVQWQQTQEIRPFPRRLLTLDKYYENLITLYILAYHKEDYDACFAALVRFQNTNYSYKEMPGVSSAVLAFQYLPEDSDLCRWLAILYAFLWQTQQYENYEQLLDEYPELDCNALAKLLFGIAHIRDPFTKGHDAAVLDAWCEVHHHNEGDEKEALCQEMYESTNIDIDELRREEAIKRYEEAKDICDKYVEDFGKMKGVDTLHSASLARGKRKSDSPAARLHKKCKRSSGRGGFGRGST